jgi:hypothetical protein
VAGESGSRRTGADDHAAEKLQQVTLGCGSFVEVDSLDFLAVCDETCTPLQAE